MAEVAIETPTAASTNNMESCCNNEKSSCSSTSQKSCCPMTTSATPCCNDTTSTNSNTSDKSPFKRTITSRTLKVFTERELRDGLDYLIKNNLVPHRPELGNIRKLNKDALTKYCQPWAMANYYK